MARSIETKESHPYRFGIASDLHLADLHPCPVGVQIGGPHEGQMHAQTPMHCRAIDTYENPIRHRGPGGIFRSAIETTLQQKIKIKPDMISRFHQGRDPDSIIYTTRAIIPRKATHLIGWYRA